jgi:hypothetical protein
MKIALDKCFLEKPLVVLTFASPLVRKNDNGFLVEMELLDYAKEFHCTIGGLKKAGNAVMVKQMHGTLERFRHVLTDNPVGLHFSGHGLKGNCLVFETNDGLAHYVTEEQLKSIVSTSSL